jgi:hypothetical protein
MESYDARSSARTRSSLRLHWWGRSTVTDRMSMTFYVWTASSSPCHFLAGNETSKVDNRRRHICEGFVVLPHSGSKWQKIFF